MCIIEVTTRDFDFIITEEEALEQKALYYEPL